ncbi:MAG: DUF1580 domain-containing protein [Planctomycetes bacterium]|nr:DUF1580 domain-containing protein [Planctomycetota bacterium]
MIEIDKENLVLLSEVPKILPKRNGKAVHLSACYRWMRSGLSGVRLETVLVGGQRFTSKEALNRFWHRVTAVRDGVPIEKAIVATSKPNAKQAAKELEASGW